MNIRALVLAAASLGTLFAQNPLQTALVSTGAVIETIRFEGVDGSQQTAILERIGVRQGDALSVETRHRIGRELNKGSKSGESSLTFTYMQGTRPGTAILLISLGC